MERPYRRLPESAPLTLALALALLLAPAAPGRALDDLEAAAEESRSRIAETEAPATPGTYPVPFGSTLTHPLFIGVDDATIPAELVDPTGTLANVQVPLGVQYWGAAYDVTTDIVYLSSGSTFHHWPVGAPSVTTIGNFTSSVDGATLSMVTLGMHQGMLVAGRNISSTNNPEGLYEIDPVTGVATLLEAYADAAGTDIGGLDSDPVTGLLYGTNDASANRGLVQIPLDGSGTYTIVAPYPAGETDIDGLAVGTDGRAYMIEDDSVGAAGSIHVFDLDSTTYLTPIPTPWATSETFAAGAWIYELPPGCSVPALAIPDNLPAGADDSVVLPPGPEFLTDLDVLVDATHTWVGDLIFTLTHVESGTSVTFYDRPGVPTSTFGCSGDNLPGVHADDEGADGSFEDACLSATPAFTPDGHYTPNNPLSVFDGESLEGTWTLNVSDNAGGDTGTLNQWCLVPAVDTMPFLDGFETGDTSRWSATQN